MGVDAPMPRKEDGLSTLVNLFAAPREAFETLRIKPMWGWAFSIAFILFLAGAVLALPAGRHASVASIQKMERTSPFFVNMSEADKQKTVAKAGTITALTYIFVALRGVLTLLLAGSCNTVALLIFNAAGKGQGDFKRLWCGSMNIAVPTIGVSMIVLGIICLARGADAFNSTGEILRAMPSLASLAPNLTGAAAALLAAINPFTIWGFFLNAALLTVVARMNKGLSYTGATLVLLLTALAQAGFASLARGFGLG